MTTVIDRRRRALVTAIAGIASLHFLSGFGRTSANERDSTDPVRLLGSWEQDGTYYAGCWDAVGNKAVMLPTLALPFRGHGVLIDPQQSQSAIVVARRPGVYLLRFDMQGDRNVLVHANDPGAVFNGHAAYSADGKIVYTTENSIDDGKGLIGVRDAVSLEKQRTIASGGLDPHAVLVEPEGTLLVANGGILTLPETGRTKLNLARMDPSLVRLDPYSGKLLGQWRLPDPRLSIRHLARTPSGKIGVALQAEHDDVALRAQAPVFACFDGKELRLAEVSRGEALGGYATDVACMADAGAEYFAVSCTRTDLLAWWDGEGRWQGTTAFTAVGALATIEGAVIAAGQRGGIIRATPRTSLPTACPDSACRWDDHIALIPIA